MNGGAGVLLGRSLYSAAREKSPSPVCPGGHVFIENDTEKDVDGRDKPARGGLRQWFFCRGPAAGRRLFGGGEFVLEGLAGASRLAGFQLFGFAFERVSDRFQLVGQLETRDAARQAKASLGFHSQRIRQKRRLALWQRRAPADEKREDRVRR